jgi:hypothetical protein
MKPELIVVAVEFVKPKSVPVADNLLIHGLCLIPTMMLPLLWIPRGKPCPLGKDAVAEKVVSTVPGSPGAAIAGFMFKL